MYGMSEKTKNCPLISVIVPVYKVENYLRQAVESILQQTYRNLEILLVDDGSPDSCGNICDQYAKTDPRVKVFHKENGGISAARNFALDRARGDWISFVDSDDWIDPEMIEALLTNALQYDARISICGKFFEYANGCPHPENDDDEIVVMKSPVQVARYHYGRHYFSNTIWNVLFRRDFFDSGLRFPAGVAYEDYPIGTEVILHGKKVVCTRKKYYHYRQRKSSTIHTLNLKTAVDLWNMRKQRCRMLEHIGGLEKCFEREYFRVIRNTWRILFVTKNSERKKYAETIQEMSDYARENYELIKEPRYIKTTRMLIWFARYNTLLSYFFAAVFFTVMSMLHLTHEIKPNWIFYE